MTANKDHIFNKEITRPEDFVFDQRVVNVFPDMINRSIPGYATIIPMIGMLARQYAQPDSNVFDLGCSLGAASLVMRHTIKQPGVRIVAVDNSPDMVGAFRRNLTSDAGACPLELLEMDVLDVEVENASFAVLNFTLQFIERKERALLLS